MMRMPRLACNLNLLLVFSFAYPAMPVSDCCCKAHKQSAQDCCCCPSNSVNDAQPSCCKSKRLLEPESTVCSISRRCDCKPELSAQAVRDPVKRWKLRTRKDNTRSVARASFEFSIPHSPAKPYQLVQSRAPPGNVRLHLLDCRWLA